MAIFTDSLISSRSIYPHHPVYATERKIGVQFRNPNLLKTALTHSSQLNENPEQNLECNERMEFLGDAILGSVIAEELYMRFPQQREGALTSMRSNIVRGGTLARAARRLDLGDHLLMGAGETATGGRGRVSNLSAAFEAVVGALFLDQGYEAAKSFCVHALNSEIASVHSSPQLRHPKSALQELVQGQRLPAPSYRIVQASGEDHSPTFTAEVIIDGTVSGTGIGRSKSIAEQEAAKAALECLTQKTD